MRRVIACIALVFCLADAYADFGTSLIYDEFDFKGKDTVLIPAHMCADTCAIFASIDANTKKLAANLLFQLPKGFVSVADVAAQIDSATNQKLPLILNNTAKLSILNGNANKAAGPLVLYIINNYYKNVQGYEVYEAEGFHRPESTRPEFLTLLSVHPFTLKEAKKDVITGGGVIATMSGFDRMDEQICPYLYYSISKTFSGFTMQVNGPIISLMYDKFDFDFPPGDLSATIGITNKHKDEKSGWISSYGYHGSKYAAPYASSLYNASAPFHAELSFDDHLATIAVDFSTDTNGALNVTEVHTGTTYDIIATGSAKHSIYNFVTRNLLFNWSPSQLQNVMGDPHFLARWFDEEFPKN